MKQRLWHRVLAAVMAGIMCCSMLPMSAFAADAPAAESTVVIEETVELPGETEDAELPDTTAPPAEELATDETAEHAPTLSEAAQAFIAAVKALDREDCIAKANAWGLAKLAADADRENAELATAFETAIAEADEAAAPVYEADELYAAIPEEEKGNEEVSAAYMALAALFAAMQYAMENPTLPNTDNTEPTADEMAAVLFGDLPDAPTGSYIGSLGLPVATGDTKVSLSAWNSDLTDANGAGRLDAAPLDEDDLTMTVAKQAGKEYAIVPIMMQVEYPANGSTATVSLPDDVTLLSYESTAENLIAASEDEKAAMLNGTFTEVAASASGFYVQASEDFTATISYTAEDETITKTLHIKVAENGETYRSISASGTSTYAVDGPAPPFTSGVITKTQRGSTTWLIWFAGQEAYCCSHGLQGKVNGCPTYGYAYTSLLEPGQVQSTHEATQINIWGALGQLNLGLLAEQHTDSFVSSSLYASMSSTYTLADTEVLEYCYKYYDDLQMHIILNYPDSMAAKLYVESAKAAMGAENSASIYASSTGYYTWIYTPPISGWQTLALIGPPVGDEEIPDIPPVPQEFYADWSVGPQSASGSFDSSFGVNTDKIQLDTLEKVDGAVIEIEPIEKGGTIDGGNWNLTPADKQTVTTGGHTDDNNYQNNGGDASASWSLHYEVSKTTSGGASGSVGPYSSQSAANDAASDEESSARRNLQAEAQRMVDNAIATAKAQLSTLNFRYDETVIPYGFDLYDGENGSKQTITVPADSNSDYLMRNDEWSLQVNLHKTDSETGKQIAGDAWFEMNITFTYDNQALEVLDSTCENEATSMSISKRELTGDDELPGATLTIQDKDGNAVREWVSTDKPTEISALHFNTVYTLTETRPADGYALADSIKFKLVQKQDETSGAYLNAADVYVLTGKDWLIFNHWEVMQDGMVVMRDDTTKVQISKQDITSHEELSGAHLTITDESGKVVEDWTSTDKPHYIEKLPAGKYTLTEVQAPNGYDKAESIIFEVLPIGTIQTVTMYDRRTPPPPSDTPEPTPESTPTPTPVPTIPQTGDNSNLGLMLAIFGASVLGLAGMVILHFHNRKSNLPTIMEQEDKPEELAEDADEVSDNDDLM